MKALKNIVVYLLAFFIISITTSCSYAKKTEVTSLRGELGDVKKTSAQALNTANEALNAAQEANERSRRLEEMLNRGFKKSMYK